MPEFWRGTDLHVLTGCPARCRRQRRGTGESYRWDISVRSLRH